MNDKEYTYDIDKYTIGVDTNGEDGIGMTIAIIKNGEINVLGNCYGENARCIDLLIKENQELKKQLEKYEDPEDMFLMTIWATEKVKDENKKLKKQLHEASLTIQEMTERDIECPSNCSKLKELKENQQEFIKYLEDEKDRLARECSNIYEDSLGKTRLVNKNIFDEVDKNLQKYKEIIGLK